MPWCPPYHNLDGLDGCLYGRDLLVEHVDEVLSGHRSSMPDCLDRSLAVSSNCKCSYMLLLLH